MPDHDDVDVPDDSDDSVFALGRSFDELTPEEQQRRQGPKRFALLALAVVIVVVALAIALVSLLVDTSARLPRTPSAAAQQWARDLVRGDGSGRRALECPAGARGTDTLRLVLTASTDARAGDARRVGSAWRVHVNFLGPDGRVEAGYTVDVVRRAGRYLVC